MQGTSSDSRYVLVTGSSTGIGKACAVYLARRGFSVLAGVRKPEDAKELESAAGANLQGIQIDIADSDSIAAASTKIIEIMGESGLAGLVNNAGISINGPLEFLTRDNWRKQFEVNVFGHMAVTQALLPALRQHVTARGTGAARIIFIGSIAGRISMPILGPYCATKHAIASISISLRAELRRQGIHVCLIEPGSIQSEIWRKGEEVVGTIAKNDPAQKLYGPEIDAVIESARASAKGAIPADHVARLVHRCMSSAHPPRRQTVGRDAMFAAILRRILPERIFEKVVLIGMKVG